MIATPVGGIPEIVRNHENGILIQQNPAYLAKAIQCLLENKDVRFRMGRKGRKYVVKRHSLENTCKKLCAIYEQLI